MSKLFQTAALLTLGLPAGASSQQLASKDNPQVMNPAVSATAVRASRAPVIDGRDDDDAWRSAPVIDQFLEYEPDEGVETRFKTEARVMYDNQNFYVVVRMFDPAPDSIVTLLARRDVRVPSEQLKIIIDSYHDRRTAYQFAVNPAGVKRDFYLSEDSREDPSWDAVWDVATTIDSLGWVAEYKIPWSQLRYASKPSHTFGFMIVRDVARTQERISWPLFRRNQAGLVSQFGEISGIVGIPAPRRIEVVPYIVTKNATQQGAEGYSHKSDITAGADVKFGITSNLTVDATINPDFGQVEADPAQLNLTAFETFFGERRPFFLEGSSIFSFPISCDDGDCNGLFYSRRIGRNPQLSGIYGDGGSPTSTTILGAAKLTGRLGNGLSVGLMDAVTQREAGPDDITLEPRSNYLVGRLQQDLRNGNSGVGLMLTAVNRDIDDASRSFLREKAYTGGIDARHRFLDGRYLLSGFLSGSTVSGDPEAIALLQRCTGFSCGHSYERPDDDLEYDPTRTRLTGDAEQISLEKIGGGVTRFSVGYQRFSPGFEINDVGFLPRGDQQMAWGWFGLQFNTPRAFYRRAFLNFNEHAQFTTEGLRTSIGGNFNAHVQFKNTWWAHFGANAQNFLSAYDDREARGGPAIRRSASGGGFIGFEGDSRRRVIPQIFGNFGTGDDGHSRRWSFDPSVDFRASTRFTLGLGVSYSENVNDNQFRAIFGEVGVDTTHYTFARLDQTTLAATLRTDLIFTPNLSLQIYAQPFVTTGAYANWRELSDPRAEVYDARYQPFIAGGDPGGFNFTQFNSNTVLRWEYRPGSTLFFVWQQGRENFEPVASSFDFDRDRRVLFDQHPNNTLLIKGSYWINF